MPGPKAAGDNIQRIRQLLQEPVDPLGPEIKDNEKVQQRQGSNGNQPPQYRLGKYRPRHKPGKQQKSHRVENYSSPIDFQT
ncbi:hypothetical protein [Roseibium sp.]|uniref:hypothetical protein n=1 Tax=Roseibium sp. TaxID=1936156 RepID=UPI003D1074A7